MAKKASTAAPHVDPAAAPIMAGRARAASEQIQVVGITIPWTEILTILMEVVKALAACGLMAAQASKAMNNPSQLYKAALRRHCRRHFRVNTAVDKTDAAYGAILDQGRTITEADAVSMYHEAGVMVSHEHG